MRILVLTDYFPPHFVGGYEIICQDVTDALRVRGHAAHVVTSEFGVEGKQVDGWVHRVLTYCDAGGNPPVTGLIQRGLWEREETARLKRLLATLKPDLVFVWHFWFTLRSLLMAVEASGLPVAYYISDYWLENYRNLAGDRWFSWWGYRPRRLLKRTIKESLLAPAARLLAPTTLSPLRLEGAILCSRAVKQRHLAEGFDVANAPVIYPGVRTAAFPVKPSSPDTSERRLLYVGRLVPEKGVHTAIEAVAYALRDFHCPRLHLTLVGDPRTGASAYVAELRERVRREGLQDHVQFAGRVEREDMPAVYRAHDVLVFPSVWSEPFSVTLLEAMSSGLAVIATPTGGSSELLRDEENSLLFPPEDGKALARAIVRLLGDPGLFDRIATNGARQVRAAFDLSRMVDAIEDRLYRTIETRSRLGNDHGDAT